MIEEIAPAKINLYLHVGPLRDDGLHELKSLFVFADDGDRVRATRAERVSLDVTGPFASALGGEPVQNNLVFLAAKRLQADFHVSSGAHLVLDKRLPVAAGIGGGSADAAAALRALVKLWALDVSTNALQALAFELGADIPACLAKNPQHVGGAGEELAPGPVLPALWVCLVNPGIAMPTGPVFRAFDAANPAPRMPEYFLPREAPVNMAALFAETSNDLEPYAARLKSEIADVLQMLAQSDGVLGARMSGSGATCFAVFASRAEAENCAHQARDEGWWAMAGAIEKGEARPA